MSTKIIRSKNSASSDKKRKNKFKIVGRISNGQCPRDIVNKKEWVNYTRIDNDLIILRGCLALTNHRFGYLSRGKQGSAACAAAPTFAKLYPIRQWSSVDLDRIVVIADKLYRTTIQKQKLRNGCHIKPNCIFPSFFIDLTKVTNFIGGEVFTGSLDDQNSNILEVHIEKFLKTNDAAIVNCEENYYVLWKDEEDCVCFCPHFSDTIEKLTVFKKEFPCLIKSRHLHCILNFLKHMLSIYFTVYSLKIVKAKEVCRTYSHSFLRQRNEACENLTLEKSLTKLNETRIQSWDNQGQTECSLPSFSADFSKFDNTRGSLSCNAYVDDPNKILCTNVASLICLQEIKSYLWTSETLIDIITLGNSIFESRDESYKMDKGEFLQDVKIHFANKTFKMEAETIVFGVVQNSYAEGFNVKTGLEVFLQKHSLGLLQGPQSVAIWKEGNVYFMFDAKERDRLGRKWTRINSCSFGDETLNGSACLTWFTNVENLVELYVSNIPPKRRSDSFRILGVSFITIDDVRYNWNSWLPLENDAWILRGFDSVCNYTNTTSQRISHALCATTIACVYSNIKPETVWTRDTISELISYGFDFYKTCLEFRSPKDTLIFQTFLISDLKRYAQVEGRKIEFIINEYAVLGFMLPTSDEKFDLVTGLKNFFTESTAGILMMPNECLAVWITDGVYYTMDPFERNNKGMNPNGCYFFMKSGAACATRFNRLEDMAKLVLGNIVPTRSCEYHIASVTCIGANESGMPALRNYEEFTSAGAILRAYPGIHEQHSTFDSTADILTLCNLVTALGFSHLQKASGWTKEHILDIFSNGNRMYCTILNEKTRCGSSNLEHGWEILGDHFEYGGKHFVYSRAEQNGVFMKPNLVRENNVSNNIQTLETEARLDGIEVPGNLTNSNNKPSQETEKYKDLVAILSDWKGQKSIDAILQSNLFDISLWKESGLYFVFDPKASDFDGALTPRRLFIAANKIADENLQFDVAKEMYGNKNEVEQQTEEGLAAGAPDIKNEQRDNLQKWMDEIEKNVTLAKQIRAQENEGSAYVAWFHKFETFVEHILSKVPKEYISEEFTFNAIKMQYEAIHGKASTLDTDWRGFQSVGPGSHWILRATTCQNDSQFPNKNKQDTGNCVMSLAFALMCPANKYSSTFLDIILKYGNRFYVKSIEKMWNTVDVKMMCDTQKLELKDLIKSFSLYKHKFQFEIKREFTGVLNKVDNINLPNEDFHEAISELGVIANNEGAILMHKNYYVAIWNTMDFFFMFDPHPNGPHGNKNDTGVASLSRVTCIDDLFKVFLRKFECIPGLKLFNFYTVEINKYQPAKELKEGPHSTNFSEFLDENVPQPEHSIFDQVDKGVRILRVVLQNDDVSQIHTCLAALVFNEIICVEYWTKYIFNQIAYLGFRLYKKSTVIQGGSELYNATNSFEAIVSDFKVNGVHFHVNLGGTIRGPISSTAGVEIEIENLGYKLALLLKSANTVILKIKDVAMSIWIEKDVIYMFYVNPTNKESNVIAVDTLDHLYKWLQDNAKDAGGQELYEIRAISLHKIVGKNRFKTKIPRQIESPFNFKNTKAEVDFSVAESRSRRADTMNVLENSYEYLRASILNEERTLVGNSFFPEGLKGACLVAAGMAHVRDIRAWNSKTLDAIVESGMILYTNSLATKQTDHLEITELEQNILIFNERINVVALLSTQEIPLRENIFRVIQYALEDYKYVHISSEHKYFTVMKQHDEIFLFHPGHSIYCSRLEKWSSVASLFKFNDIISVVDHILREVKSLSETLDVGPIIACIKR